MQSTTTIDANKYELIDGTNLIRGTKFLSAHWNMTWMAVFIFVSRIQNGGFPIACMYSLIPARNTFLPYRALWNPGLYWFESTVIVEMKAVCKNSSVVRSSVLPACACSCVRVLNGNAESRFLWSMRTLSNQQIFELESLVALWTCSVPPLGMQLVYIYIYIVYQMNERSVKPRRMEWMETKCGKWSDNGIRDVFAIRNNIRCDNKQI